MKKTLLLLFLLLFNFLLLNAQDKESAIDIVKEYAKYLSLWAEEKDNSKQRGIKNNEIKDLLSNNPTFRINNRLVKELRNREKVDPHPPGPNGYEHETYFVWLKNELDSTIESGQKFIISLKNIKKVPLEKVINSQKDYEYVECELTISSKSYNFKSRELFHIYNTKIVNITPYEDYINQDNHKKITHFSSHEEQVDNNYNKIEEKTSYEERKDNIGNKKMSLWERTWNDIRNSQGVGLVYEYGKNYPVNVSLSFYKSLFMLGLDMGLADTTNHISTQKVDFTDILNYKITKGEYKPKYYFTLTPAIYMKYVSVGWGVGVLTLEGETITEGISTEVNGDNINPKNLDDTVYTNAKYRFFMRPNVKLYIPCSKSISIITSASYNWTWGSKDLSGFTYGIGLRYNFD